MAVSHVSEDERALIAAIREIAQQRVAPRAAEIDRTSQFPLSWRRIFRAFPLGVSKIKWALL